MERLESLLNKYGRHTRLTIYSPKTLYRSSNWIVIFGVGESMRESYLAIRSAGITLAAAIDDLLIEIEKHEVRIASVLIGMED